MNEEDNCKMATKSHPENQYILQRLFVIVDDENIVHKLKPGKIIACTDLTAQHINMFQSGTLKLNDNSQS